MKLTAKNSDYTQGGLIYPNAYLTESQILLERDRGLFRVIFAMYYGNDQRAEISSTLMFTPRHTPTLILDSNDEPIDVIEFIDGGGTYDVSRIVDWGFPSYERAKLYFDLGSVWDDLQFKEQPLKQLAIDWLMNTAEIDGEPLKIHFNEPV